MKHICVVFIILLPATLFAQAQNNIWAFGINCGLDFSTGIPVLLRTHMQTSEGAASACNANGQLLFYSDGNHVWDRNGNLMPHGDGLLGNTGGWAVNYGSATQGVTIVPFIDDTNRFYLFTTDCIESVASGIYPGYLRYSLIDMRLNNGLGDVDSSIKNIKLLSHVTEKAYAVAGAGCYNWLLTHSYGSGRFLAYKIGVTGLDTLPVVSYATTLTDSDSNSYMAGELKVSPDERLLATCSSWGHVELFSFDKATGHVSDARALDSLLPNGYGIGFSPTGNKLYVTPFMGHILQYDLSLLPDMDAVNASATAIGDSGSYGTLRLGPDGKLYTSHANENLMIRINDPDAKGTACNITDLSFSTDPDMHFQIGLGNPVPPRNRQQSDMVDTITCISSDPLLLQAPPGYSAYLWSNGDTTAVLNADASGLYWVRATGHCPDVIDTFRIQQHDCNCIVSIPTAFSPNGDGRNDRFNVLCGELLSFHMEIYNRWGQPVFYTSTIGHSWDGTYNGRICDAGTYYYFVKLRCLKGDEIFRKGDVTLVR
jgi:gliding motility-associated-like protein